MKYQNLEAWKKGMELVKQVYQLTANFPKEELFGLTSQLRRSAVSVPANIAEGIGRNYKKDTIQFLHIARGLAYEMETLLNVSKMVGITTDESIASILTLAEEEKKIINGLIRSFEERMDLN
jgi:four helix bundle protein